jgi:hypothetical protein
VRTPCTLPLDLPLFSTIGAKLADKIDFSNDDVTKYINNSPTSSFFLKPVRHEVKM